MPSAVKIKEWASCKLQTLYQRTDLLYLDFRFHNWCRNRLLFRNNRSSEFDLDLRFLALCFDLGYDDLMNRCGCGCWNLGLGLGADIFSRDDDGGVFLEVQNVCLPDGLVVLDLFPEDFVLLDVETDISTDDRRKVSVDGGAVTVRGSSSEREG